MGWLWYIYNGGSGRAVWSVESLRDRLLHYFSMDEHLEPNSKDKYQQAFEITYPE
jgi:hypothetical protein